MTALAGYIATLEIGDGAPGATTKAITVATASSRVGSFTTGSNHGLVAGDLVRIAGVTPTGYNGDWLVLTAPTTTTFTAYLDTTPTNGTVFGTVIKLDSFTTIAAVVDLEPPEASADDVETTTRDSAGYRYFLPGLIDGAEISLSVLYDSTSGTHQTLRDAKDSRAIERWKIRTAGSTHTQEAFRGHVSKFKPATPIDGAVSAEVTVKVTGPPVRT